LKTHPVAHQDHAVENRALARQTVTTMVRFFLIGIYHEGKSCDFWTARSYRYSKIKPNNKIVSDNTAGVINATHASKAGDTLTKKYWLRLLPDEDIAAPQ